MQGGFSFCGEDIANFGLEYVPDLQNTYVYSSGMYSTHEQTFEGHHGGYYYGSTLPPKMFTLRCIYQGQHINQGVISRIEQFFRQGRSGRLVFKQRPWMYYIATVVALDVTGLTNYMNGFVTIQLKSFYPFGRCDEYASSDPLVQANSTMISADMMPQSIAVSEYSPQRNQTTQLLYNGGTANAPVAIEIAGNTGTGVTIANMATNQKCHFVALSKGETTDSGKYFVSDSMNGKNLLIGGPDGPVHADLYHDYGYLDLAPGCDLIRHIPVTVTDGVYGYVRLYTDNPCLAEDCVGQYIYIQGEWREIVGTVDSIVPGVMVNPMPSATLSDNGLEMATIATLNKIIITPDTSMEQTRLNFKYKPTFA